MHITCDQDYFVFRYFEEVIKQYPKSVANNFQTKHFERFNNIILEKFEKETLPN